MIGRGGRRSPRRLPAGSGCEAVFEVGGQVKVGRFGERF